MNDERGPAPGPEPLPEPGPEQGPVSVPAAAKALGISERAVRKRIHAGTLRAQPFGRSFMVWLPDDEPLAGPEPGPAPRPEHGPELRAEPGPEPIEAAYRVVPAEIERAIERTGARYMADFAQLYERISADVGRLYEGQLAAKDETIATQREALATQADMVAELRQRAEAAEVIAAAPDPRVEVLERQASSDEVTIALLRQRIEAAEAERDRLIAAQAAPAAPHEAEVPRAEESTADSSGGFLTRVRRFFGGE